MKHFIETILKMKRDLEPSKMILFTDSEDLMEEMTDSVGQTPIIISTHKAPMASLLQRSNVHVRKMNNRPEVGINVLKQAKDVVLSCVAQGLLDSEDMVLFVISTDIDTILSFNINEIGVANLRDSIDGRVDLETLEAAFNIGTNIVREGKEGMPAGALFIIGDTNNVIKHTRESIQNPLEGCRKEEMNITDEDNWNTVKEYAMLDGAFVMDRDGYPVAAGRYVMFNAGVNGSIGEGLGGRHLAAISITQDTDALAMVVSSEGAIRIYKDGEDIYSVDAM